MENEKIEIKNVDFSKLKFRDKPTPIQIEVCEDNSELLSVNGGKFNGVLYLADGMTVHFVIVNPENLKLVEGLEIKFRKDYINKN